MLDQNRGGNRYRNKTNLSPIPNKALDSILPRLSPKKRSFVMLLARGKSIGEIVSNLKMSIVTSQRWRKQRWYYEALNEELERLRSSVLETFKPMLPDALATYQDALTNKDTTVARDVLDRVYGKPLAHELSNLNTNITIVLTDISGKDSEKSNSLPIIDVTPR